MPRFSQLVSLLFAAVCLPAVAQSLPPGKPPSGAMVRSVRVLSESEGPTLEIVSSRPIVPAIQKIEGPDRLVIDLPGSLALHCKRAYFSNQQIQGVRVNQFQQTPPVTRVVVDLLEPIGYTWDASGTRLMIRLHAEEELAAPPKPDWSSVYSRNAQPAVLSVSSPASSGRLLVGNRLAAGSSVTAGSDTAVLELARGGEVRVCPGTTVSLTASQNNQQLMLGMSTGALEEHYALGASSDSVLTPDFRILLAGPGEFHYAVRVDSRGNTCVHALPGNTSPVVVYELLGEGTYQVKATEQVVFRAGRVGLLDAALPGDCGCPAPAVPVMRASAEPNESISDTDAKGPIRLAQSGDKGGSAWMQPDSSGNQAALLDHATETGALPASKPEEIHVQVDAPLVFRAASSQPAPAPEAHGLPLAHAGGPAPLPTAVPPPTALPAGDRRHGVLRKLKSFFVAIFS